MHSLFANFVTILYVCKHFAQDFVNDKVINGTFEAERMICNSKSKVKLDASQHL